MIDKYNTDKVLNNISVALMQSTKLTIIMQCEKTE